MALDILLPFWGDPDLMRQTVRSVLAQDSDDWLLTVVDDCYPDESIAQWFATLDDPRITYHRNETNLGITDNNRACLDRATQDVIVFLGCDDLMYPGYVRTILAAHRDFPDCDIIQPGVDVIDEHGEVVDTLADQVKQRLFMPRADRPTVLSGEELAVSLLRANWTCWPSLAFRREAVVRTPFLDGFPLVQDLALQVDMVAAGSRMLLLPDVVFAYRRHAASASSAKLLDGSRFEGERRYFEIAAERVARLGWKRAERAARNHLASRLYAATLLPTAVREKHTSGLRSLAEHLVRPLPLPRAPLAHVPIPGFFPGRGRPRR